MGRASRPLELRLLGPPEVYRRGELVELPQSRKTRALLAYLALTGREHRRERLCALLWDVTDDPRGALRWSLSKLRRIVDDDSRQRLVADRSVVAIDTGDVRVDVLELRRLLRGPRAELSTEALAVAVGPSRGELLEGLDLDDFHEFQAWLVAERTEARRERQLALGLLVERLASDAERALPFARARVEADPLDGAARVALVELLLGLGRAEEASQHLESGLRLAAELGAGGAEALESLRRRVRAAPAAARARSAAPDPAPPTGEPLGGALVGRSAELARLEALAGGVQASGRGAVVLVAGEPGVGKSRLLDELAARFRAGGGRVLRGRAFEVAGRLPYGPWHDVLAGPAAVAGAPWEPGAEGAGTSREVLFAGVARRIAEHGGGPGGALLVLDDVQWMDADSCELLHYVARSFAEQPLLVVLAARPGELEDNDGVTALLRTLRRASAVEELALEPLGRAQIAELLGLPEGPELEAIFRASAGNPLFAMELARGWRPEAALPSTVTAAVRERIARLPAAAADVLRWAAALGHELPAGELESLVALAPEEVVEALEALERHGLLRIDDAGCRFAHDIVRLAVYHQLSTPRRRLMHRRIARLLADAPTGDRQVARLAHHAVLAGDAALAVRACIRAGEQALRVFAASEAEALARRGLSLAGELELRERLTSTIDLHRVRLAARRPADVETTGRELSRLAEDALDQGLLEHARLAFHMLAFLRWEHGPTAGDAMTPMLAFERLSRSAGDGERAYALAEAARCLVLLERDLPRAEALALEAQVLSSRGQVAPSTLPLVVGMLAAHRGDDEVAARELREACAAVRAEGDHLAEYRALEALVMFEIDRERYAEAAEQSAALLGLGERIRVGSEAPAARALVALVLAALGEDELEPLGPAIAALREVDAKHRLAFVCNRAARLGLARGRYGHAVACAEEALGAAQTVSRATEVAFARVTLAQAYLAAGEPARAREQLARLRGTSRATLSSHTRAAVERLLTQHPEEHDGPGDRDA